MDRDTRTAIRLVVGIVGGGVLIVAGWSTLEGSAPMERELNGLYFLLMGLLIVGFAVGLRYRKQRQADTSGGKS